MNTDQSAMCYISIDSFQQALWKKFLNPLMPDFFLSFFVTYPKIGSSRLSTQSRNSHRNFFDDPF